MTTSPTARVVDTVTDVPESTWDRIAGASYAHTHRWLRLAERHVPDHRPRYVLVYEGDALVAAALTEQESSDRVPRMMGEPFQSLVAGAVARRMVVCRAPLDNGVSGLAVGETRLDGERLMACVLDALDRRAYPSRPVVEHFPVPAGDPILEPALRRRGLFPNPSLPVASMAIPWGSWDDYLASLKGKWRVWIRGVRRNAYADGMTARFRRPRDVEVPDREIYAYLEQVATNHGRDRALVGRDFLEGVRAHMNDHAIYVLLFHRERFVAFGLGLRHGSSLAFPIVGLDYAVSRELKLVSLLYYEMIQCCIDAEEVDFLNLGITNEDMKRRVGCTLTPRWWFIRSPRRLLDRGIQAGLRRKHGDRAFRP